MSIMQDYARKYDDSVSHLLSLNTLRNEYDKKIHRINTLRNENLNPNEWYVNKIVRNREIEKLEKELFCGR